MSNDICYKEVDFTKCVTCEHYTLVQDDTDVDIPCHECLNTPAREYSHTPLNYKEKE